MRNIAAFTASAHRAPIPQTRLLMKAHDKLAAAWKLRSEEMDAKLAIAILQAKSSSVEDFGSRQVVEVFDVPGC